jgi:hypothetical protein
MDSLHPIFQFATSDNIIRLMFTFWDIGAVQRVRLTLAPAISELKLTERGAFNPNIRLSDMGERFIHPKDRCWKTRGLTSLEEAHAIMHCEFPIVKLSLRVMPCQFYFAQEAKVEQYDVATQSVVAVLVPWGEWNSSWNSMQCHSGVAAAEDKTIAFDVSSTAVGNVLAIKVSVRHSFESQRFPSGLHFIEVEGAPRARKNRRYILAENIRTLKIEKARKDKAHSRGLAACSSRDTDSFDWLRRSHGPEIVGASRPPASSF